MSTVNYITKEGLQNLKDEYTRLVSVERPSISQQIADARDKGDLSENAEYDAAKEAQGLLEMKIAQLEEVIRNSRIIDESKLSTDAVQILNKVKIKNLANNTAMEYTLVSETEADLKNKKLSINTPIAKALLGHKVGDVVEVTAPAGLIKFEIIEIGF
ncbi:MAG: transcription elongation factor GreA [Bacteroidales bacterium]|nr:transcription elongation factor GreA [Bacteroidales bacterium]